MKNESQSIQQLTIDDSDHFSADKIILYCSQNNEATYLCQNRNCDHPSMMCSTKDCQCQIVHKKCLKTFTDELFAQINQKIHSTTEIKDKIEKIIDQAIDYISQCRDDIYSNIKYLGLNTNQKELMELLNKKEYDQISGSKIWKVCQGIYTEKEISPVFIIKNIDSYWSANEQKFKKHFEKLKELSEKEGKIGNIFQESQILTKYEDTQTLNSFFSQDIVSAKLLYSAKKSNYRMRDFQQACRGKRNTLLIVKSQQGKTFGFFLKEQIPAMSPSMNTLGGPSFQISKSSFGFSLTNKDKFNLMKNRSYAVVDSVQGATFGDFIRIYKSIPNIHKTKTLGNIENANNFNNPGLGGFGNGAFGAFNFGVNNGGMRDNNGGFGVVGQGFDNLNEFGTTDPEGSEHHCVVSEGNTFRNEKYQSNSEIRQKITGVKQVCFPITQWQFFELKFEKNDPENKS